MPIENLKTWELLELVWYLNNSKDDIVWISIFIYQTEFHHGIIAFNMAFDIHDPIVVQMFFDLLLQLRQGIGKIDFQGTWVVGGSFHDALIQTSIGRMVSRKAVNDNVTIG